MDEQRGEHGMVANEPSGDPAAERLANAIVLLRRALEELLIVEAHVTA